MATVGYTHIFSNGTPANANEVNKNFDDIKVFADTKVVQIDGSVKAGNAAIADGAISNSKLDYTSVPRITVSANEPPSMKAGDVWVQI